MCYLMFNLFSTSGVWGGGGAASVTFGSSCQYSSVYLQIDLVVRLLSFCHALLARIFNKIRLIFISLGLLGDSKVFEGKLVGMEVICRTNIKTAPGGIYGIFPGATSSMW